MKSITYLKSAVLIAAVSISFNSNALSQSDAVCTRAADGSWKCEGGVIVVTGEREPRPPRVEPPQPPLEFGCKENPQDCLPTEPPPRPGASTTDRGGVGRGRDGETKDHEETTLAGLRVMDCAELRELEELNEAYVDTLKLLIPFHNESLEETNRMLQSSEYSKSEIDVLYDRKNASCTAYVNTQNHRLNGPKTCFDRPRGKPPNCSVANPSRAELDQYQRCRDDTRELDARVGDLALWKRRKAEHEENVQRMAADLRHREALLDNVRKEIGRKKCPP